MIVFCLRSLTVAVGIVALSIAGCGDGRPQRVPVSGQVLIDGQPLKHGHVRFIPQGARASGGDLDENGRFILGCFQPNDGAVLGKHQVEILAQKPISQTQIQWFAPKKYASASTANLSYEVTEPTENATFNLTWDGGKPFIEIIEGSEQEGANPF